MLDSDAIQSRVDDILTRHAGMEGALLPILHAIQEDFGMVPEASYPAIAKALNISKAEVHGVVSFYHDFRTKPAGRHVVKLCRAESCKSVGADLVADHAKAKLGLDWHETSANGAVTLEPIFCLGLCACGPAAMVDGKLMGHVDEAKIDAIVEGVK